MNEMTDLEKAEAARKFLQAVEQQMIESHLSSQVLMSLFGMLAKAIVIDMVNTGFEKDIKVATISVVEDFVHGVNVDLESCFASDKTNENE